MGPSWPGVVYHIYIITAAVGSQQMTVRAKQHGEGSLISATYFKVGGRSIQLVRFTTAKSREIIYTESKAVFQYLLLSVSLVLLCSNGLFFWAIKSFLYLYFLFWWQIILTSVLCYFILFFFLQKASFLTVYLKEAPELLYKKILCRGCSIFTKAEKKYEIIIYFF